MSLGIEMREWRKQLVEKLLLNGVNPGDIEKHVGAAQLAVYGGQIATIKIECPFRCAEELKTILLDFSQKNGCYVIPKVID